MKKEGLISFICLMIIVTATVFLIGCSTQPEEEKEQLQECTTDADCVQNECCHASGCVSKENAPDCSGVVCSQECALNTLDCGQGRCVCENGKCWAAWNEMIGQEKII